MFISFHSINAACLLSYVLYLCISRQLINTPPQHSFYFHKGRIFVMNSKKNHRIYNHYLHLTI